jgi:Asp-tRNA(Asn)/Glu-tRNA(Gln) amidotransferase A subunit family amidase
MIARVQEVETEKVSLLEVSKALDKASLVKLEFISYKEDTHEDKLDESTTWVTKEVSDSIRLGEHESKPELVEAYTLPSQTSPKRVEYESVIASVDFLEW